MQTDPQPAAVDTDSGGQPTAGSPWTTMGVYRRRLLIVAAALFIVLVAFVAAAVANRLGAHNDPFQVAWVTLSVEIVAAVYKWGVGGWSRYTPPDRSHLSGAGSPRETALPVAPPAPSPRSVPADPRS